MRPAYGRTQARLVRSFASLAIHQKKSLVAAKRRRAKVRRQRDNWFKHRLPAVSVHPERVVFIAETSVKANLTRLRGWAPCGDRLVMDAPFGSWGINPGLRPFRAELIHWINSKTPFTPHRGPHR